MALNIEETVTSDTRLPADWHRVRPLVRLTVVAMRRTARENSVRLLAAFVAVVLLYDGARRVTTPRALDTWLIAALTWSVVLPVALTGHSPLRSVRLSLQPISPKVLQCARIIAGAPIRLIFAVALTGLGSMAARGLAPREVLFALTGWAITIFFVGAALDELWYRPRAALTRAVAAATAAVGAWCLWSIRAPTGAAAARVLASHIPELLPREGDLGNWTSWTAMAAISSMASLMIRGAPRSSGQSAFVRRGAWALLAMPITRLRRPTHGILFRCAWRPLVAHEIALLARHLAPRICLALVVLLALAATYGRVPGIALIAGIPMIVLSANALGADFPLNGIGRHALLPQVLANVRDRRLTVWSLATALAALLGMTVALMLPLPTDAGQPAGGVLAAPVLLGYAAALVPWFGRASWWWARRYPQPLAQCLRAMGASGVEKGPMGSAPLALGLLAVWAVVALLGALLWAASYALAQALVSLADPMVRSAAALGAQGAGAWIGGTVLASAAAAGAHVALSSPRTRNHRNRSGARMEATA